MVVVPAMTGRGYLFQTLGSEAMLGSLSSSSQSVADIGTVTWEGIHHTPYIPATL